MAVLNDLLFRTQEGWTALPDWAWSLVKLGDRVTRFKPLNGRLVVALALPTRAFGAALIGASAVASAFDMTASDTDLAEHFELLASLPRGTAITHHRGNSIRQGRLIGVDNRDGVRRVGIETGVQQRKMTSYLPIEMCREIQVIEDPGELRMRRRPLIRAPEFLARALNGIDAASLSATTRIDCLLVGSIEPLRHEIVHEQFAVGTDDNRREGNLQAILRAKRFAGQNAPHRSEVVAAGAESIPAAAAGASPPVVIFDGAPGFINWRSRWPRSNWIILLDRSAPSTQAGADTINYEYSLRLTDSEVLAGLGLPPSIETVSYVERAS